MDGRKSNGSTFTIPYIMRPISKSGQFPSPEIKGHISVDQNGDTTYDKSQMRHLKRPDDLENVSLNLDEGYVYKEEKPEESYENIDMIIKWISKKNNWEEVQKPENRLWLKSYYWGWKMEQLLTESKTDESGLKKTQEQHGKYLLVNQLNINAHSLVFNSEIDAYDENTGSFVEIKTMKHISSAQMKDSFEKYKLLHWWAQSQLGGVQEILCGFRDKEGLVTRIGSYQTSSIPHPALPWNQNVCFHFLDKLLTWIKTKVAVTGEFSANRVVHLFERSGEETISHSTTTEPRYQFLKPWYLNLGDNDTPNTDGEHE